MREFIQVTITEKGEKMLRGGHIWVYADEVISTSSPVTDGELVDVKSQKGKYLGTGFFNSHSKIRIRIISKNANDRFDEAFWRRRILWAIQYRHDILSEDDFDCCRLIFGESDQFPGLTVDRYHNVLVIQVLSLGMELNRELICRLLLDVLRHDFGQTIDVIYERSDVAVRELEGLEIRTGFVSGEGLLTDADGWTQIKENGIIYKVDYVNGQKTGFFLDQKFNRASIRTLARGKHVLDCCTHTGSFALNAAQAGAEHVTALDISADALKMAKLHAVMNGLNEKIDFVETDLFEYLDKLFESHEKPFDFIILDPPAFTKSRDTLQHAIKGYLDINTKALRLLPRGGYLATCSCSHFMADTYFKQMLHNAAEDAGVSLRQIEARKQSPDHPILWNVPETDYLKFFIFQIC